MKPLPHLIVTALLASVLQSTQAEELPFSVQKVDPVVTGTREGVTIAFASVHLSFPEGWAFTSGSNPWKLTGPNGLVAFISVLHATAATQKSGMFAVQRLQTTRVRMSRDGQESCGTSMATTIDTITDQEKKISYATGCEERRATEVQFAVQYELISERGVVQLIAAGNGSYAQGRKIFDPIALGYRW